MVLITTPKNIYHAELFCETYGGSLYFPEEHFNEIRAFTKSHIIDKFYVALKLTENGLTHLDNTPFPEEICISHKQSNSFCSDDHVIFDRHFFSAVTGSQMYPFLCQFDSNNGNATNCTNCNCIPCETILDTIDVTPMIGKMSQKFDDFCISHLLPSNSNNNFGTCSRTTKNLYEVLEKLQKEYFEEYGLCKLNQDCEQILPETDCFKCKYVLKQMKHMFFPNQEAMPDNQYIPILNFIFGDIIIDYQDFNFKGSRLNVNSEDSPSDLCELISLC